MNRLSLGALVSAVLTLMPTSGGAPSSSPLTLTAAFTLPGVEGRLDHLAYDPKRGRLYIVALEAGTLLVLDLASGKVVREVQGLHEPQGVVFLPARDEVVVTAGGDGTVTFFNAATWQVVRRVDLGSDADNIGFNAATGHLYVGYGSGALGVLEASTGKVLARLPLPGHPESFQVTAQGDQAFVNVPDVNAVLRLDLRAGKTTATWRLGSGQASLNFPMTLNEAHQRLFVGTRHPAELRVLDVTSGRTSAALKSVGDADDVWYDAQDKWVLVSGGEGAVDVFARRDADQYTLLDRVPSAPGARTSLFVSALHRLFVAAPRLGDRPARLLVYRVGAP